MRCIEWGSYHIFSCPEQLSASSCWLVGPLVGPLVTFVKKWPLEYQMVTKTYITSNLCDSSNSSDSCDNSDSSDSSDRSDSSDQKVVSPKTFFTKKNIFSCHNSFFSQQKKPILTKNLNCDETQKLKLWWNSKTQILMKLKNSNCDETKKTQIVMKLKKSNCDETQQLKLRWNSKTQIMMKLKNSNCDWTKNSNFDDNK